MTAAQERVADDARRAVTAPFDSAAYWERRYGAGGTSGAGSQGRLAKFKAGFVNAFVRQNAVESMLDLGCGDGRQAALLDVPDYVGIDVSPTTIARCRTRFAGDPRRRFQQADAPLHPAELALSMDILFHLVEDAVFDAYLDRLFGSATRYVLVYASNVDLAWPAAHVRHRAFTPLVSTRFPDWRLAAHVPNLFPYDPARPDDTSFADFFVYTRRGERCVLEIPTA